MNLESLVLPNGAVLLKDMDDEMEHDEDEDDSPGMLRSSILTTLGIEEV